MKSPLGLNAELPVGDLISEAINLLWQKRSDVLRMFLPAIFLLALVDWIGKSFMPPNQIGSQLLFMAASLILSILFATAAHRFTLLPPDQWDRNALHMWGRAEFVYLLRALQIGIISGFVLVALMTVLILVLGKELMPLAAVASVLPTLYLCGRMSITLPEVALGRKTNLRRSWEMSEGNGTRMVLVVIIVPLLMTLPFLLLYLLKNQWLNYVAAFGSYITTLISLVMLSLSYRFLQSFYDNQQPPEAGIENTEAKDSAAQNKDQSDDDQRPGSGGFDA